MGKTNEEIREEIENAILVIGDFWEADEEEQQKALETATKCMNALLKITEGA